MTTIHAYFGEYFHFFLTYSTKKEMSVTFIACLLGFLFGFARRIIFCGLNICQISIVSTAEVYL